MPRSIPTCHSEHLAVGSSQSVRPTSFRLMRLIHSHTVPSAAVSQQAAAPVNPDMRSPEYSTQPALPSQFSASFHGAPDSFVDRPVDQSSRTSAPYPPPSPLAATCRQCGASNPPSEPSRIYEGWSWTAGPSDHPAGEGSSDACASKGVDVSTANTLRFRPY